MYSENYASSCVKSNARCDVRTSLIVEFERLKTQMESNSIDGGRVSLKNLNI
jgi:hypothetical protein